MNEESENKKGVDESTAAEAPEAEGGGEAQEPLLAAQREAAEMKDRLLRTLAELENYRRRAEKERQDTAKFAIAGFARDMLSVADNLRRGLETVSEADRKSNPALDALASGMELTERETLATLERHGIRKVDPLGQPFDHNFHQAMMEVEDASVPAGTVAQVMQAGYVLNERLLRPAMVAVAKGGPKAGAEKAAPVHAPIANDDLANAPERESNGYTIADPDGDPEEDEENTASGDAADRNGDK